MADLQRRRPATRAMLRPVVKPSDAETSRKHRPDYWLIALVLGLLVIGLIVLFSISPALSAIGHVSSNYYVNRQLLAIGLGIIVLVITTQLPLGTWRQIAMPLLMLAGAATLLAIVMPVNPNYPAHRWVRLGGLSFQSVELLKFALLVWLAGLLQDRVRSGTIVNLQETLKPILIALAVVGVVVVGIQSDLGSMGVIIAMVTAMLFVAGLPLKRLAIIAGIVLIGLVLAVSVIPYRRDRLMAFLHPSSNCQDSSLPSTNCGWLRRYGWARIRQWRASLWVLAGSIKRLNICHLCREVWVHWGCLFIGDICRIVCAYEEYRRT
jgi:cell division protein FtsW (lipid II flippase)